MNPANPSVSTPSLPHGDGATVTLDVDAPPEPIPLPAIGGGRMLAKEVLWVSSPARAAIKNGNTNEIYQRIWRGADEGVHTLEQDLARLVQIGDIAMETGLDFSNDKRRFLSLAR